MNYIKRHSLGCYLGGDNKVVQKGIKDYLNQLCIKNLSTFDGRKYAASKLLNKSRLVPVYINKNVLLIQTKSLRMESVCFINYFAIHFIESFGKHCIITFHDGSTLEINLSHKLFLNKLNSAKKLLEIVDDQ
jgi:competence protein ComK